MTMFLSRLCLDRSAGNAALAPLLDPDDPSAALSAHHRLLWTLFADGPDRKRDFLWRAEGEGRFLVLSQRPPRAHDLFAPPEVKAFDPALAAGDRLAFALRANATRDRAKAGREGTGDRRVDVVMDLLRAVPSGDRAVARAEFAREAAGRWLGGQAARFGFGVLDLAVEDYRAVPLPRPGAPRARLGILDLAGRLEITDPAAFLARLRDGFGRARAFGCGLMLIRRI